MLIAYFAMTIGATVFLGPLTSLGVGVIQTIYENFTITYLEYFTHNAPFIIYGFLVTFILFKIFKQDQQVASKEVLTREYKDLGGINLKEKKLIVIFVVLLLNIRPLSY